MAEQIPNEKTIDDTIDLLKEGYLYIKNRTDEYRINLFETRLLGQKAVCISGEEAVKIFYDPEKFKRNGAAPKRVQKTLFGENAIQTLDGKEHIRRKALFLSLMGPDAQQRLAQMAAAEWEACIPKWEKAVRIVLFDEAKNLLCRAACRWAGVPLREEETGKRAQEFMDMVYAFGAVGPRHWKGRMARTSAEDWVRGIIEDVRADKIKAEDGSVLKEIALYRDKDGRQLDAQIAAVELINVLRPITAIATFITFAALSLLEHPRYKGWLEGGDEQRIEWFAQEVRRFYPFGPFLGAKVRKNFTWNGYEFKKGLLVLLDMYGTNHDEKIWGDPDVFRPERFRDWNGSLFNFIPHGGSDPSRGHRCPGEGITLEIMKATLDFLVNKIDYDVPAQNLNIPLNKIPTLPESGFIIQNVKKKTPAV
ncbi:fatty-acid peroxygenase [Weizmannia acidilactici]|uniref:cytochrome P450 n=1 Tax=Weizmannia acidilactici TaxID=2607726 RepID=UPI00124D1714|nr:cytochrome P450 [Weizmannia acidilactici]GER67137.1 fatty-acid peroxygenase [Weizmannia acidilactici]